MTLSLHPSITPDRVVDAVKRRRGRGRLRARRSPLQVRALRQARGVRCR